MHVMPTYAPLHVRFARGRGSYLYDENGKRYLDALTGIGVCVLGHAHPGVSDVISRQAKTLIHTSNLYEIPLQQKLAKRLCELSGMETAFFANSGAEANEAAIKIARLHGRSIGIDTPEIVVMDQSFHGRTIATLTASGNRKIQAGFEPLAPGFVRAPYDDAQAVQTIAENNASVAAVLVEPILGEGGVRIPSNDYLLGLKQICEEHDWLLMVDEAQTGAGRTGMLFAYLHSDIVPDVVTCANGLANGLPIGACLARGEAATTLQPGVHGSTCGGNPLVCATALVVLKELIEGVMENVAAVGAYLSESLRHLMQNCTHVSEIRQRGMMIGIELDHPCTHLVQAALEHGLLLDVTADSVIRLFPPLTLTRDEADEIVSIVAAIVQD